MFRSWTSNLSNRELLWGMSPAFHRPTQMRRYAPPPKVRPAILAARNPSELPISQKSHSVVRAGMTATLCKSSATSGGPIWGVVAVLHRSSGRAEPCLRAGAACCIRFARGHWIWPSWMSVPPGSAQAARLQPKARSGKPQSSQARSATPARTSRVRCGGAFQCRSRQRSRRRRLGSNGRSSRRFPLPLHIHDAGCHGIR